jgi:hypothetical protein
MEQMCKYGCGLPAKKQLRDGTWICGNSPHQCPVNRAKNTAGLRKAHADGKLSTKQFDGKRNWNKGLTFTDQEEYFSVNSSEPNWKITRRVLKEKLLEQKCEKCGLSEWLEDKIPLQLHHKNKNHHDNRLENLEFLCANCHMQIHHVQKKYPKNTGRKKVSDLELLEAIKDSQSLKEAADKLEINSQSQGSRIFFLVKELLKEKESK